MVDVTVFIPVYNGANYINHAIESVLRQTVSEIRIVVSDNCSTDDTRKVVGRFRNDPRVELVAQPSNVGMVGNFNACLSMVDTQYFMMLCHDDYIADSRAIERAREVLQMYPEVVSVYSDIRFVDGFGQTIATRRFRRRGILDPIRLARRSVITTRNHFGIPILNRTCRLRGLRYDHSIPYVMDVDLSLALAAGGCVYHIEAPLIANRYHGGNSTFGLMQNVREQDLRLAAKHSLQLSFVELLVMRWNTLWTAARRRTFQLYLRCSRRT